MKLVEIQPISDPSIDLVEGLVIGVLRIIATVLLWSFDWRVGLASLLLAISNEARYRKTLRRKIEWREQ